jgi:shikimate kinase
LIISTGGGLVLKDENNAMLKKNGKIVFLRASLDTLAKRLKVDGERPLLQTSTENIRDRLARLLGERSSIYEQVADYIVDVDDKKPQDVADEILRWIENI